MKYDIFISYRRKDSSGRSNVPTARQFKLALEAPPYNYKVFFDYSECTDNYFSDIILPAIRTCDFFVLVLTKDCLLRCSNDGDWVRREIEEAIAYNRKIIPITPDKECEFIPSGLPASLRKLDGLQITTVYTDHMFEACVEFLVKNRFHVDSEAERKAKEEAERVRLEKERIAKAEAERRAREAAERERIERERKAEEARRKAEKERIERERREAESKAREKAGGLVRETTNGLVFTVNGVSFNMVKVEGGTFLMGADNGKRVRRRQGLFGVKVEEYADESVSNYDGEASSEERPVHNVKLNSYYLGETEVTQALWKAVTGGTPSYYKGDNLPVESVSYNDIMNEFIPKLNRMTGRTFSIPTEAEWEFAAKGGNKSGGNKYAGSNIINNVAWHSENTNDKGTRPVKEKSPNELGLFDMSGNVMEWCRDWFGDYSNNYQINPEGPLSGSYRVLRGGSWNSNTKSCRVSSRSYLAPIYRNNLRGFRLALYI